MKPTSTFNIASFFVKKGVSPLQLQKLLYYAQVWYFVKTNDLLFLDDIKAWKYGPVIPDVWHSFKYIRRTDMIPKDRLIDNKVPSLIVDHLNQIWDAYGSLSASQLVDQTHSELPWIMSRIGLLNSQPSTKSVTINKSTTKDFFLDLDGKIPVLSSQPSTGHYSNQHY